MTDHVIDTLYEREIETENFSITLSADVSIDYIYSSGRLLFLKADMLMGRTWVPAPKYIAEWAEEWLNGDGQWDAIQKAEDERAPDPDRYWDARDDFLDDLSSYRDAA